MNKRSQKAVSMFMLVILLFTTIVTVQPPQEVTAAVISAEGAIPSGGSTGKDGGVCPAPNNVSYRIGLTSEAMSGDNIFEVNDSNPEIEKKLKNHYKTHMALLQNSVMFIAPKCYTQDAAVGWYEPSNGSLSVKKRVMSGLPAAERAQQIKDHDDRVRELNATNINPGNLFYTKLVALSPICDPNRDDCNLGDMSKILVEWKKIIAAVDPNESKSKQVWNYIFGDPSDIAQRLKDYIGDAHMDEQHPHKASIKAA